MKTMKVWTVLAATCVAVCTAACSSSDSTPATTDTGTTVADGDSTDVATSGDTGSASDAATDTGASSEAATDTGATTDSGAASDGSSADAATCTPIANVGMTITKMTVSTPPPAMTGGTVVDGTYVLTATTKYNGVIGSNTHKTTILFAGGKGVNVDSTNGAPDKSIFFDYSTSGNTITLSLRCGATGMLPIKYTATATTFMMMNPDDANESQTYTKM